MIPRADVESIPYLITLATLLLYIYILQIYNVRKRIQEQLSLILVLIGLFTPLGYTLYNLSRGDLTLNYVFEYTYSGMSQFERLSTVLYSMPWDVFLALIGVGLIILRIYFSASIYRGVVRNTLSSYLFGAMSIPLVLVFYPPFEFIEELVALDGKGIHPITLGMGIPLLILVYLSLFLAFASGALGLYLWREPGENVSSLLDTLLKISAALLSASFFLRMMYNSVYAGRDRLFNYTVVDIAILSALVASILLIQLRAIAGSRVIGASAASSYILLWTSVAGVSTLHPDNFFPTNNILNTGVYLAILVATLFTASFPISREIFRRSFLPWFSDKEEVLVRSGSSVVLISIALTYMIVLFNISIYSTFGDNVVRVSEDFINMSIYILSVYPFISLLGTYIAKKFMSINAVIFGVFGVYALFGGGYNYGLWIIREYIGYLFILSIPMAIFLFYKYRLKPASRLVFTFIFGLMIFSQVWFEKGPSLTVDAEGEIDINGLTLSNPVFKIVSMNETVYVSPDSNDTEYMLIIEEASFDEGVVLRRYLYEARNIRFAENLLMDSPPTMYIMGLITGSDAAVSIYASKGYWGTYLYFIMILLMGLYIYLSSRYDLY